MQLPCYANLKEVFCVYFSKIKKRVEYDPYASGFTSFVGDSIPKLSQLFGVI